jgi:hypothetical protein
MPCAFFNQVPKDLEFDPELVVELHVQLVETTGTRIKLHFCRGKYTELSPKDGSEQPVTDLHVEVVGYPRSGKWCNSVAALLHRFVAVHGYGSDIAVRHGPNNSPLFYINGKLARPSGSSNEEE